MEHEGPQGNSLSCSPVSIRSAFCRDMELALRRRDIIPTRVIPILTASFQLGLTPYGSWTYAYPRTPDIMLQPRVCTTLVPWRAPITDRATVQDALVTQPTSMFLIEAMPNITEDGLEPSHFRAMPIRPIYTSKFGSS